MSNVPADLDAAGRAQQTPPAPGTTPGTVDPDAAGRADADPFTEATAVIPTVAGSHAPGAWQELTTALGRDLQGGLHRAEQARRRIGRMR